jgi:hypothetical protein
MAPALRMTCLNQREANYFFFSFQIRFEAIQCGSFCSNMKYKIEKIYSFFHSRPPLYPPVSYVPPVLLGSTIRLTYGLFFDFTDCRLFHSSTGKITISLFRYSDRQGVPSWPPAPNSTCANPLLFLINPTFLRYLGILCFYEYKP